MRWFLYSGHSYRSPFTRFAVKRCQISLRCFIKKYAFAIGISSPLNCNDCCWLWWWMHRSQRSFEDLAIHAALENHSKRSVNFFRFVWKDRRVVNWIKRNFFFSSDNQYWIFIFYDTSSHRAMGILNENTIIVTERAIIKFLWRLSDENFCSIHAMYELDLWKSIKEQWNLDESNTLKRYLHTFTSIIQDDWGQKHCIHESDEVNSTFE